MPIVSISGIRGVFADEVGPTLGSEIGAKFGSYLGGGRVAVACDTRTTSHLLKNSVIAGLTFSGTLVFDLGFSSTPSVFKEVTARKLDGGLIITASHNPPEWNGIKIVQKGGRGVFEEELQTIQSTSLKAPMKLGRVLKQKAAYEEILRIRAGKNSVQSVNVALDLAGGVGSLFIPSLLAYQGCTVHSIHDSPGIFPRIIDPTNDPLIALSHAVISNKCDAGFAFDCDADRLVIVDSSGRKLSGDATLLICLQYFLENTRNRTVAVSVDTSLAAEDLLREYNGRVIYAKVGEANVVKKILENNCGAGGEGSSGGYIEPSFVICRDGVYASTLITRMIKEVGSLDELVSGFRIYFQDRAKLDLPREFGPEILGTLSKTESNVDTTDGVKIRTTDKSWVLIRASNTENVMRISAEAKSQEKARELVVEYSAKVREIGKEVSNKRTG